MKYVKVDNIVFLMIGVIFTLSILGCQKNIPIDVFQKDKFYEKSLENTKKGEIVNSFETKVLIVSTYLNPIIEGDIKTSEMFLTGIYPQDDEEMGNIGSIETILLNYSLKPIKIKKLESNDPLIKYSPFQNKWMKYYLIEFEKQKQHEEAENLSVIYQDRYYGQMILTFQKFH